MEFNHMTLVIDGVVMTMIGTHRNGMIDEMFTGICKTWNYDWNINSRGGNFPEVSMKWDSTY